MPVAGISMSLGIDTMMSGLPIVHPSLKTTGAGRSLASPSSEPFSAHSVNAVMSAALRNLAFSKCPTVGSANHGGIVRLATALAIALAYGRVSVKFMNDIGAMAPGRWHSWQF